MGTEHKHVLEAVRRSPFGSRLETFKGIFTCVLHHMHDTSQDSSVAVVSDGMSKAFQANDLIVIDVLPFIETAVFGRSEE